VTAALEASTREERVLELRERGGELRFLSRLLAAPPDAEALADAEVAGLVEAGWRLEDIQVEYTRLLSCPGPAFVPAHQSVYTDTLRVEAPQPDASGCGMSFPGGAFQGYLGGPSCAEASHWYAVAGFEPSARHPHMADHVSLQLAFVAELHLAEARAVEESRQGEARSSREIREGFEARLLGQWLARFAGRLAGNGVSEIYRRIGRRLLHA
jgi:TorA maturation chaperone TorD